MRPKHRMLHTWEIYFLAVCEKNPYSNWAHDHTLLKKNLFHIIESLKATAVHRSMVTFHHISYLKKMLENYSVVVKYL